MLDLAINMSEYICSEDIAGLKLAFHDQNEESLPDILGYYVETGTEMHFVIEMV